MPTGSRAGCGETFLIRAISMEKHISEADHRPAKKSFVDKAEPWLKALALITPIAYLIGHSYHHAFYRACGVLPDDFSATTSDYLYTALKGASSIVLHLLNLPQNRPNFFWSCVVIIASFMAIFYIAFRLTSHLKKKFNYRVRQLKARMARTHDAFIKRYAPEIAMLFGIILLVVLPFLAAAATFVVILIPAAAEKAGRSDGLAFWHSLEKPEVLNSYPTAEVSEANGHLKTMHVIDVGTTSYLLYDGQQFAVVRKELVAQQKGAAPPWRS